ncbi:hypothetical protein Hanom_Chr03g00179841 [Helianthus anomalus]
MTSYCSSIHSLCSFSSDEPFNLLSSLHINGFICLWATPVVINKSPNFKSTSRPASRPNRYFYRLRMANESEP